CLNNSSPAKRVIFSDGIRPGDASIVDRPASLHHQHHHLHYHYQRSAAIAGTALYSKHHHTPSLTPSWLSLHAKKSIVSLSSKSNNTNSQPRLAFIPLMSYGGFTFNSV